LEAGWLGLEGAIEALRGDWAGPRGTPVRAGV